MEEDLNISSKDRETLVVFSQYLLRNKTKNLRDCCRSTITYEKKYFKNNDIHNIFKF